MAFQCTNINQLASLLRERGDQILDASSKLCLSTSILFDLNQSVHNLFERNGAFRSYDYCEAAQHNLQLVYDFIQKTLALKVLPDNLFSKSEDIVDLRRFRNLRLLEIQRLSLSLIRGIKSLRAQLEYLTCIHSLRTLSDILETCGGDRSQGFVWRELKEAVFSYNSLDSLDNSLEFTPLLQSLDLSHNRIHNAQTLNCLPNLRHLNLSYNQLESVPAFSGPLGNRLKVLDLQNNFIESLNELRHLPNVTDLNLNNNCLLSHESLAPLFYLSLLANLSLTGNPISFHPQHRRNTCKYLAMQSITRLFVLDGEPLSKAEKHVVGEWRPRSTLLLPRSHLDSLCSSASESTIVPVQPRVGGTESETGTTTDLEASSVTTLHSHANSELDEDEETEVWTERVGMIHDNMAMQDSGIVAGRRPTSPSEDSIGSATSLKSEKMPTNYESDIEVLSNPSQGSINVYGPTASFIRHTSVLARPSQELVSLCTDLNNRDITRRSF